MTEAANPANDVEPITVEWKGVAYTLPPVNEWDVEVMEAMEDGKATSFVRAVLGPARWAKVKAGGMTVPEFNELGTLVAQAYGFDSAGE